MKKQLFSCDYCAYKSAKMENVVKHFETKHNGCSRIKCWICGEELQTITDFKKHIGTYHYKPQYEGED